MCVSLSILVVVSALMFAGCQVTRGGYESAPYCVVRTSGNFEVRDYPVLWAVATPMTRTGKDADGSFMRLFHFITGANAAKQKIAMTTPVFMSGSGTNATMAFVLPANLASNAVPQPSDGKVSVRELPAGRFAVLRFSGGRNARNDAKALDRLRAWMQTERLREMSPPTYGYFDPPWTPGFLRRNEVMLRTDGAK